MFSNYVYSLEQAKTLQSQVEAEDHRLGCGFFLWVDEYMRDLYIHVISVDFELTLRLPSLLKLVFRFAADIDTSGFYPFYTSLLTSTIVDLAIVWLLAATN